MRSAENFSGLPPPNGIYEWSPLLEKTGRTVTYWKLRLNLVRSKAYTSDRLQGLLPFITMEDSGSNEVEYVREQLTKAWQGIRTVQKNAIQNRAVNI